jgi:hypothetical protein
VIVVESVRLQPRNSSGASKATATSNARHCLLTPELVLLANGAQAFHRAIPEARISALFSCICTVKRPDLCRGSTLGKAPASLQHARPICWHDATRANAVKRPSMTTVRWTVRWIASSFARSARAPSLRWRGLIGDSHTGQQRQCAARRSVLPWCQRRFSPAPRDEGLQKRVVGAETTGQEACLFEMRGRAGGRPPRVSRPC